MPLEILHSVSSTMDVARENIRTGRVRFNQIGQARYDGVLAWEQTAGRGQRGRGWYAAPGESLTATYYFRRGLVTPQRAGEIALLAGIALASALEEYVGYRPYRDEQGEITLRVAAEPQIGLKWPNDLLIDGKKAGGILTEMIQAPDGDWVALIGVGVNVHVREFPDELAERATSLALAGVEIVSVRLAAERIATALQTLADVRRDEGLRGILKRWRTYDRTPGLRFQTEVDGERLVGVATGIDDAGALLLRLSNGQVLAVTSATSLTEA